MLSYHIYLIIIETVAMVQIKVKAMAIVIAAAMSHFEVAQGMQIL